MLLWLSCALIASVYSTNEVCPDGKSQCPDTATCCELTDKSYGCCPFKNAVCCDDHIHCSPQHTKCEVGIQVQLNQFNVTSKILPANSIHCKDCPHSFTCCEGPKPGRYSCCPLEHGVCCSDGHHCCPEGTVCDLKQMKCLSAKGVVSEMYNSQKTKSQSFTNYLPLTKPNKNVESVVCPDETQCPNSYTCCKLPTGRWGCCPFVNATCCKDNLHCCPHNMQCASNSTVCFQGHLAIPSSFKEFSKPATNDIVCPDNRTCADSMTCCKLRGEHYGCCPYPNASCCSDHSHCCPENYACDEVGKRCVPKQKRLF